MKALKLANLGIWAVIQAADCMTLCRWLCGHSMWTCFAFDLEDDAVGLFWIKILQENVSTV